MIELSALLHDIADPKFHNGNEMCIRDRSETFFGGKGATQAVGTARLGASVYFIGSVGMDPYGQQILRNLVDENVNVGFVHEDTENATGTAYVTAAYGKNAIVVVPVSYTHLDVYKRQLLCRS